MLLYLPFLWMGFNCLKTTEPLWGDSLLLVPRTYWYSLNRPWKGKKLSWSCSHLAVLNAGPLDRESSMLNTRPFLLCSMALLLQLRHFLWSRVGFHYRADKKYKNYLGKLCFKGQIHVHSFLVELIFILLRHVSQGESKPLQINHKKL